MANVSLKSRYKDTFTYALRGGGEAMGPFQLPAEFATFSRDWTVHVVQDFEVGFPDIIVVKYYGAGAEQLWWVVCLVNGVIDPDLDIIAGQHLRIPPRDLVSRYVARRSRG